MCRSKIEVGIAALLPVPGKLTDRLRLIMSSLAVTVV